MNATKKIMTLLKTNFFALAMVVLFAVTFTNCTTPAVKQKSEQYKYCQVKMELSEESSSKHIRCTINWGSNPERTEINYEKINDDVNNLKNIPDLLNYMDTKGWKYVDKELNYSKGGIHYDYRITFKKEY